MTSLSDLLVEAVSLGLNTQEVANIRSTYDFGFKFYEKHLPRLDGETEEKYRADQERFAINKAQRTIRRTIDSWHRQADGYTK